MNQDKSARYHALHRRAAVVSGCWSAAFLLVVTASDGSVALRNAATRVVTGLPLPAWLFPPVVVALYVVVLGALHEIGELPIALYRGFLLERRYGLSNQRLKDWLRDQLKGALLGAGLSVAGFVALYVTIAAWPQQWWLVATAGFVIVVAGLVQLAPVLLMPLFFTFKPLGREELRHRLVALSTRAGVSVLEVLEWRLADRTKKGNAALAGLGKTRRIIVSDTLLASCNDDEIEAVLAHELGHHAHHDIWRGIAMEGVIGGLGFYLASRALAVVGAWLGLRGPADVAGLPVLLLTGGLLSLLLLPAVNGFSRWMERRADRYGFNLTGNPEAFASAMQRLHAQNLAEEHPSRLTVWLFHSHPTTEERIEAARRWRSSPKPGTA